MKTNEKLEELKRLVLNDKIEETSNFGGAGIILDSKSHSDNYDYYVITKHSRKLSWVFNQIKNAFNEEVLVDHLSKFDFYKRLAESANKAIKNNADISAKDLCLAVIKEAEKICSECVNN